MEWGLVKWKEFTKQWTEIKVKIIKIDGDVSDIEY